MKRISVLWMFLLGCVIASNGFAFVKDSVMIPMRDGVRLYANIYFPDDTSDFPLPVILRRTPYGADAQGMRMARAIRELTDEKRYIVVIQDLRGRHESEGEDSLFREDGWGDLRDGYDTIEWLAQQPWCDGHIAMYGGSAHGITQYLAAGANPPHLTACFPMNASWNMYEFVYQGGEFRQNDVVTWTLGNSRPEMLELIRQNYNYSEAWDLLNCNTRIDSIHVPMFHVAGWLDMFAPSQLEAFYMLQYFGGEGARGNQKLIIGPWTHNTTGQRQCGQVTFPENARVDLLHEYAFPWYDYWLKDSTNGIMDIPNIQLYLMGPTDTSGYWNSWLYFDEWPFDDVDTLRFYLSGDGTLRSNIPPTDSSSFIYDPRNPVPTVGGHNLTIPSGIFDQSPVWNRPDVLTFVTDVATEPYDIFGRIKLKIYASSNRLDTDFTGKLVDVYPDGRKMLITDGILMARHRLGFDREDFLIPGVVYEFEIDLNYTAYTIAPGHRLGLAVSSSNYPKYAVNPNTDEPVNYSQDTLIAINTVYFGQEYPSVLILPIRRTSEIEENEGLKHPKSIPQYVVTADDVLRLQLGDVPHNSAVSIEIFDSSGRTVERTQSHRAEGDGVLRVKLPKNCGVYYIYVKAPNWSKVVKVLKLRG